MPMVDYINRAFFARDKATVAAIVADAEKELEKEPDGDEGEGSKTVNVHVHGGTPAADAATEKRLGALEDSLRAIDRKMTSVMDAVSKVTAKTKDEDEDEKKEDPEDKEDDDDAGDDDDKEDDDDKKTDDADASVGVVGAMTAKKLPSLEAELMEADPALKTGKSKMGDAETKSRRQRALANVVRDCAARAELLAPGIKIQQLDSVTLDDAKVITERLCGLRKTALVKTAGSEHAAQITGRYTADAIKDMSCDAIRMLFVDASDRMRAMNNARGVVSPMHGMTTGQMNGRAHQTQILKGINQINKEFWDKQSTHAH
jgi:hypothetical protein